MTSAWNQLEQLLTCAICLDRFRNPKLLPCQHTFCGEPCMEGLVDYARRQIKCPECRAEHRIPYNGVQTFPNNVTLARFLDLHREVTGEEPEPVPSMMERCGVCSEKAFCDRCSHCDKKVCTECKEGHLEILRREIVRINSQIRRGLNKLTEQAQQTGRNSDKLQQNHQNIREEITESVRRFIKDLKDKEAKLLHELDEYTQTEAKSVEKLKDDLDVELANLTSNCELAEKHITENDDWTDAELVEYKEIFVKTQEFLRNVDIDTSDFSRKIKFLYKTDIDVLRRSLIDFGELKISTPNVSISPSNSNSALNTLSLPANQNSLVRSQSDHRLAAQFQQQRRGVADATRFLEISGSGTRFGSMAHSDSERDTRFDRATSPTSRRTAVTDRLGRYGVDRRDDDRDSRSRILRDADTYTRSWPRPCDDEPLFTTTTPHFRSRFMRERHGGADNSFEDTQDSDYGSGHNRSVRFEEPVVTAKVKVFETEEAIKGPLSGVMKLTDSPFVMFRLHQNEIKSKIKDAEEKTTTAPTPAPPISSVTFQPRRPPSRQVSEDEIEKQKKANQVAAATTAAIQPVVAVPQSPTIPEVPQSPSRLMPRRVTTLQKEEDRIGRYNTSSDSSRRGSSSDATIDDSSQIDEETGDTSGIARLARRRQGSTDTRQEETETAARVAAAKLQTTVTATQARSIRSPLGKTLSVTHQQDSKIDVNNDNKGQSVVRPAIGSDKKDRRTISSESDSDDSSDSSSSSSSASDSDSESDDNSPIVNTTTSGTPANTARSENTIQFSAQARRDNLDTRNSSDTPLYGSTNTTTASAARFARQTNVSTEEPIVTPATVHTDRPTYKIRKLSDTKKEEEMASSSSSNTITPYQSKRIIRRAATFDDEVAPPEEVVAPSSAYSRYLARNKPSSQEDAEDSNKYSYQRRTEKYDTNTPSYRSRLSKSKSSHSVSGYDESDDENVTVPTSPSYKSKYGTESSILPVRKISRSGYTYRTREQSPIPADDEPVSVSQHSQYLINKYGSNRGTSGAKPDTSKSASILRSKSSHAVYGRSISSSDEEVPSILPSRRSSRDTDSILPSSYGFTYQRNMYQQKKKMNMKIGSRGTGSGCFTWPRGVTCAPNNNIVVADSSNHRVQVFDSTGRFIFEFGSYGSGEGEFDCLASVCVNRLGQYIVSDRYNHRIQTFDPSGRFLRQFGVEGRIDGRFSYPWGVTADALGFIYVCDKENHRIQVFQSDGTFVGKFGTIGGRIGMLEHPHYVAVSNTNRVITSDSNNHRIQIFDVNGRALSVFGTEGSGDGQFKFPRGVAVDEQGYIIVGDSGNNRVQIFNPDGTFLKAFGTWGSGDGEFKGLEGLAISSTGNILVCDRENHRIQIF